MFNLLIKFPTRSRPEKFFKTLDLYISLIQDENNYKIVVNCDRDDLSMNNETVINRLKDYKNLEVYFGENKSKIEAINADMQGQKDFDIILLASDDMIPVEQGYDVIIKENMRTHFPDLDGVLWFNDGNRQNELNTLCILGKKYYERFNYIYHPTYKSLWCDNEFTEVSKKLKKQIYIDKILIKHDHPDWNKNIEDDELYQRNIKLDSIDHQTFIKRKKKNFDLSLFSIFKERINYFFKRNNSI